VFVIIGDHTFQYNEDPRGCSNPAGRFSMPYGFFTSGDDRIAQHLDPLQPPRQDTRPT
jgi:hypothetical protein